jgi:hypothetical protein
MLAARFIGTATVFLRSLLLLSLLVPLSVGLLSCEVSPSDLSPSREKHSSADCCFEGVTITSLLATFAAGTVGTEGIEVMSTDVINGVLVALFATGILELPTAVASGLVFGLVDVETTWLLPSLDDCCKPEPAADLENEGALLAMGLVNSES